MNTSASVFGPDPREPPRANVGGVARGCPFADRCPEVMTACREAEPQAARLPGGHVVRCLRVEPVEGEA